MMSKKSPKNLCPECNRSLINANGSYCSCWESRLPKNSKNSIKAHSTDAIEIYSQSLEAWAKKKEVSKQAWINRFKECGLDEHEIELMLLRFYEENEFKQIVRKCGWVSVDAAAYAYKKAIGKLRRKGFSFG